MVPMVNNKIQKRYPRFKSFPKSKLLVLDIALGDASRVVNVVLNMVVNAAITYKYI